MPFDNPEKNVSKTHFDGPTELGRALDFARRLYGRVAAREMRSHRAIRMLVAQLALAVRAARNDPDEAYEICRKAKIKGRRLEVRIVRLITGVRLVPGRADQVPRWANAAAYVAAPLNGDPPPERWRDAIRYIDRRGGVRSLSNLYAGRVASIHNDTPNVYGSFPERLATGRVGFHGDSGFYESNIVEWYTPPYIFQALGCKFDLDPASPGAEVVPWIPARRCYTEAGDGLARKWSGFVWLNPPFGRGVIPRWVDKFVQHGNGIMLVPERTSTQWWQHLAAHADLILCMNRRIQFETPTGEPAGQFPIGTTLVAIGQRGVQGLIRAHRAGFGILLRPALNAAIVEIAEARRSISASVLPINSPNAEAGTAEAAD